MKLIIITAIISLFLCNVNGRLGIVARNSPLPRDNDIYPLRTPVGNVELKLTGTQSHKDCSKTSALISPITRTRNDNSFSYIIDGDGGLVCVGLGNNTRTRNHMYIAYAVPLRSDINRSMKTVKNELITRLKLQGIITNNLNVVDI